MQVTSLYAGLLALMFVTLSVRVIAVRRTAKISFGDTGNRELLRRIRVHANFAEYVPFGLILLALAELQHWPPALLHFLGACLLAGRLVHSFGVGREPELPLTRVIGMTLTFISLLTGALTNLTSVLWHG